MKKSPSKSGFTIIEVVLVLAIAGLIFLMVFIALPALQRSQRDTARKNDASAIAAAINSYASNNSGTLPPNTTAGLSDLLKYQEKLANVSTSNIQWKGNTSADADLTGLAYDGALIYLGGECDGNQGKVKDGKSTRKAAVVIRLESGTGNLGYCQGV